MVRVSVRIRLKVSMMLRRNAGLGSGSGRGSALACKAVGVLLVVAEPVAADVRVVVVHSEWWAYAFDHGASVHIRRQVSVKANS